METDVGHTNEGNGKIEMSARPMPNDRKKVSKQYIKEHLLDQFPSSRMQLYTPEAQSMTLPVALVCRRSTIGNKPNGRRSRLLFHLLGLLGRLLRALVPVLQQEC